MMALPMVRYEAAGVASRFIVGLQGTLFNYNRKECYLVQLY